MMTKNGNFGVKARADAEATRRTSLQAVPQIEMNKLQRKIQEELAEEIVDKIKVSFAKRVEEI